MYSSVQAFLGQVLDYAGMFPPAALPLADSLRNYARYRKDPDHWMLGRFVCPAARLSELTPFHQELFHEGTPFIFTVIGRGGDNRDEWQANLRADLDAITQFRHRHGLRVLVDTFEVRLPPEVGTMAQAEMERWIGQVAYQIETDEPPAPRPFFELTPTADWRTAAARLVASLHAFNLGIEGSALARRHRAGFKIRCGGADPSAFPSSEQIAWTLMQCRDQLVPLKATAGLHHALPRPDPGIQARMHGFLNVFGAGILAVANRLKPDTVRHILDDERAEDFQFTEDTFRWRDFQAGTTNINLARQQLVVSFGSCSFDEPREDLRQLGWL